MTERNDPALLDAAPGAGLARLQRPRATVLAAEVAGIDRAVGEAAQVLDVFDVPGAFRAALMQYR